MRLPAALVALAALLAGCTGSSEQPQAAEPPAGSIPTGPDGAPLAAAGGADGTDLASPATRWVQEQWGARTEVPLVATTVTLANTIETSQSGCLFSCQFAFLIPDEGAMVLPGADHVAFTLTYTPPPTAPNLVVTLVYRTASEAEAQVLPAPSGETLLLPAGAEHADAPLAPSSQWWFFLTVQVPDVAVVPPFEAQVQAVAVRGAGDLPTFGEAPDPWAGGDTIPLFTALPARMEGTTYNPVTNYMCFDCNIGWDARGPGLVPPGAAELHATVTWDWAGPTKPTLGAWNRLDLDGTPMTLVEDGATTRTFTLAVPPEHVDSPWQQRTHWGLYFVFDTQGLDVAAMHGTATVDVVVARAAQA